MQRPPMPPGGPPQYPPQQQPQQQQQPYPPQQPQQPPPMQQYPPQQAPPMQRPPYTPPQGTPQMGTARPMMPPSQGQTPLMGQQRPPMPQQPPMGGGPGGYPPMAATPPMGRPIYPQQQQPLPGAAGMTPPMQPPVQPPGNPAMMGRPPMPMGPMGMARTDSQASMQHLASSMSGLNMRPQAPPQAPQQMLGSQQQLMQRSASTPQMPMNVNTQQPLPAPPAASGVMGSGPTSPRGTGPAGGRRMYPGPAPMGSTPSMQPSSSVPSLVQAPSASWNAGQPQPMQNSMQPIQAGAPPPPGAPIGFPGQPPASFTPAPAPPAFFSPAGQPPMQQPSAPGPVAAPMMQPPIPGQIPPQELAQPQTAARPKLDAALIPSVVQVQVEDQYIWDAQTFQTGTKNAPPLASTEYLCMDDGNASPRFVRATTYEIPTTADILNTASVPFALVIQPLAELRSIEAPVETVHCGPTGPVRCNRCKAYMNPHMRWVSGGQKFLCNICEFVTDVAPNYFCHLDATGRRMDTEKRPELRCGVVDYIAPKEFYIRDPVPASFVFLIDVSWNSIQSGMINVFVNTIKEMLELFPTEEDDPTPCKIGIVAYDQAVHFFNLNPNLSTPQMMVVGDIDDAFLPLSTGFLVSPVESKDVIKNLLDQLPQLFSQNRKTETCLGPAVEAVTDALKKTGGRLIVMQSSMPTLGSGALKNRDDPKLLGTDKERSLFSPQDSYYKTLAEKCVGNGVGVDLFLFAHGYMDVATLGQLTAITGGQTYFYTNFSAPINGTRFAEDLRRIITRPFGYDCLMRVRCSNGMRVLEHYGNFNMGNTTDIDLAILDSEKALVVQFKHDGKLDVHQNVSFQIALLYTSPFGQRKLRILNYQLRCTDQITNVFRFADVDATLNALTKGAIMRIMNSPMKSVRDSLVEKTITILTAYRKFCASTSSPSQLILPESLKLLPMLCLATLKTIAFRSGTDISSDLRTHAMRLVKNMGVSSSIAFLYPRLFSLHDMATETRRVGGVVSTGSRSGSMRNLANGWNEQQGNPNADQGELVEFVPCEYNPSVNRFIYPRLHRCSWAWIDQNGAYLVENSQILFLWLGAGISPQFLQDLFGISSLAEIDTTMRALPILNNPLSTKVRALLHQIQEEDRKGLYIQLQIVRQGEQPLERHFMNLMVEDENNGDMSYADFLCHVHKQVQVGMQD